MVISFIVDVGKHDVMDMVKQKGYRSSPPAIRLEQSQKEHSGSYVQHVDRS